MKRVLNFIGMIVVAGTLAGCDKCGDAVKFFPSGDAPKSCSGDKPQG